MDRSLQVYKKEDSIVRNNTEDFCDFNNGHPTIAKRKVVEEKSLKITFYNGFKNETIIIGNLGKVLDGQTREQKILSRIAEGGGHLIFTELDNLIIKVNSIISCQTVWVKAKNNH